MISGQITVTTAGTAVQGTDAGVGLFHLAAKPGNTGVMYCGNVSGDVTAANGFPVTAEGFSFYGALSSLYFDSTVNGETVCWLKIV